MISAVVLSHNDAQTIARTLESLLWCSEIIVIDDDSTDKTPNIAKTYKARIVKRKRAEDFSAQRNAGLKKAKNEWVFFVDSDEVVSHKLAWEIQRVVRDKPTEAGFLVPRRDTIFGKQLRFGETANTRLLRLGKKNAGKWVRPVHEVWEMDGEVGVLRNSLDHYPHQTVSEFVLDIKKYAMQNAAYFFAQKVTVSWYDIFLYPIGKFIHNYFFRLGFLDGTAGAIVALMMSFHSFLTRSTLWLLWHKN